MGLRFHNLQVHLVGALATLGCLLCLYLMGLRPLQLTQQELRQTSDENNRLQKLLPVMEQEIDDLEQNLKARYSAIHDTYKVATVPGQPLIATVSKLLGSREMELINLREEVHKARGETVIELQIEGPYVNLMLLLDDLRKLDRPARIASLVLSPKDKIGKQCAAQMQVRFSESLLIGLQSPAIGVLHASQID